MTVSMLTLNEVKESVPLSNRNNITQDMVDQLNSLSEDPEESRYMRENFISFSNVLQEGRYKIGDYVLAVIYVSHKVMGKSNLQSYKATFPDRYKSMEDANKPTNYIASIVSCYNKGGLVTKVMERAIVPSWILNQSMFQSALQTQYDLMTDEDISPKVRSDAANSILTHLKKPEINKTELNINVALNDGMAALEQSLRDISQKQLDIIEHDPNVSAQDIANTDLKVIN